MQPSIILYVLTCCVFNQASAFWFNRLGSGLKCGGSSSVKNFEISSPAIVPSECSYTLIAFSSFVCQIRVDFDVTLAQPSISAEDNQIDFAQCVDDVFYIGDFRLCGRDQNQHIYIPLDRVNSVNSVEIKFRIADRYSRPGLVSPKWKLLINQLQCPPISTTRGFSEEIQSLSIAPRSFTDDAFLVAPMGCSQYYPHSSGLITSFNFNSGSGIYPGNMHYAICFRRRTSSEKLSLKAFQFQLGEILPGILPVVHVGELCLSKIRTKGRSEDYILIPEGEIIEEGIRSTYFCGNSIQQMQVISSAPGPISMVFHSDDIYKGTESGFGFTYTII